MSDHILNRAAKSHAEDAERTQAPKNDPFGYKDGGKVCPKGQKWDGKAEKCLPVEADADWNFKKKDDIRQYGDAAWEQIGVVSQELEAVSPKLVKNINPEAGDIISDSSFGTLYEDGDDIPDDKKVGDIKEIKDQVKAVKYSILYMKAIKALQEAMARIETLESEVTALKGG